MDRRTLLYRTALAVAVASPLAGCTDESLTAAESSPPPVEERFDEAELDLPVERQFDAAAAAIDRAGDAAFADPAAFESFLGERDLAVESLAVTVASGEEHLELQYADPAIGERGAVAGLGFVAGGYAALVAGEWTTDEGATPPLAAATLDAEGREFGSFDVEPAWAREYRAGRTSAHSYASHVLHTLETSVGDGQ